MKHEKFKVTPLERAWILYDVGNSAFVLMIATLVPIFFNALAEAGGLSPVNYLAYWGYASSVVTVITAVLGPILGTLADTRGFKKPIFMLCLFVGVAGCCAMGLATTWLPFLIIFILAKIGFSGSLVFYDSMLGDVTTPERMDVVSSQGYAWGYIGSCVPFVVCLALVLGKEAFCDYFAAFGLREPTGVDLPAEPKKSLYYTADRMGPVELASCAFGQSSKISYMEMAAAVCAVVNGGRLMQPYLVSDILNPDGSILQHTEPVCRRQVIKPETSETMREMMEAVVLYGGGRNARIQGYRVGGKSGTSQKLDSADEKARIASFVAVAPIDDPQFLCLVCLDEPHSWTTAGGSLSAPVCAEVLEQTLVYKGVPRAVEPETDPDPAQTAADLPADGDSFDGA